MALRYDHDTETFFLYHDELDDIYDRYSAMRNSQQSEPVIFRYDPTTESAVATLKQLRGAALERLLDRSRGKLEIPHPFEDPTIKMLNKAIADASSKSISIEE